MSAQTGLFPLLVSTAKQASKHGKANVGGAQTAWQQLAQYPVCFCAAADHSACSWQLDHLIKLLIDCCLMLQLLQTVCNTLLRLACLRQVL